MNVQIPKYEVELTPRAVELFLRDCINIGLFDRRAIQQMSVRLEEHASRRRRSEYANQGKGKQTRTNQASGNRGANGANNSTSQSGQQNQRQNQRQSQRLSDEKKIVKRLKTFLKQDFVEKDARFAHLRADANATDARARCGFLNEAPWAQVETIKDLKFLLSLDDRSRFPRLQPEGTTWAEVFKADYLAELAKDSKTEEQINALSRESSVVDGRREPSERSKERLKYFKLAFVARSGATDPALNGNQSEGKENWKKIYPLGIVAPDNGPDSPRLRSIWENRSGNSEQSSQSGTVQSGEGSGTLRTRDLEAIRNAPISGDDLLLRLRTPTPTSGEEKSTELPVEGQQGGGGMDNLEAHLFNVTDYPSILKNDISFLISELQRQNLLGDELWKRLGPESPCFVPEDSERPYLKPNTDPSERNCLNVNRFIGEVIKLRESNLSQIKEHMIRTYDDVDDETMQDDNIVHYMASTGILIANLNLISHFAQEIGRRTFYIHTIMPLYSNVKSQWNRLVTNCSVGPVLTLAGPGIVAEMISDVSAPYQDVEETLIRNRYGAFRSDQTNGGHRRSRRSRPTSQRRTQSRSRSRSGSS